MLSEQAVYTVSNIKIVDRDLSINFYYKTKIEKVPDTGIIPKYKFELKEFEDVHNYVGNVKSFIGKNYVHLLLIIRLKRLINVNFNSYRCHRNGDKLWAS